MAFSSSARGLGGGEGGRGPGSWSTGSVTLAAGSDRRPLSFPAVRREDLVFRRAQGCEKSDCESFSITEM